MNLAIVKNGATRLLGAKSLVLKQHGPTIMVVTGTIGMGLAVIEGSRASLKLEGILNEHHNSMQLIEDYSQAADEDGVIHLAETDEVVTLKDLETDRIKVYGRTVSRLAKNYAPTITLLACSTVLILSGYNILNKRNAALAAAYKAVDESFRDYRKRMVEKYGEDVDMALNHNMEKTKVETIDESTGKKKKTTVDTFTESAKADMYSRLFTGDCLNWHNNMDFNFDYLEAMEKHANNMLKSHGHLFLNEVFDMLGYPRTDVGAVSGWRYYTEEGDGEVMFNPKEIWNTITALSGAKVPDKSILLSFNVDPGTIYDKL